MKLHIHIHITVLAVAALVAQAAAAQARVNPADYRELDDKQLGHLRFIANIAAQKNNDWSGMDSSESGQGGFDAYRYQLAMMSYTINLANYHYTPAWREQSQHTSEQLIGKMMRFDVWSFWEQVSRGAKAFDPDLVALSEGWRDPVIKQNIMYSGHLLQMASTYAMLYNSDKYEKPGALTFVHDPIGRGMGKEEFPYDTLKLAKVLRDQFADGGYAGIECEPNAIFAECNQHPILGFKLVDLRNGTDYYREVSTQYRKTFDEQKFLDRAGGSFMRFKLVRQNKVLAAELPWNDGWAGIFMHGWAKQDVEQIYPLLKKKYIVSQPDGSAVVPFDKPSPFFSWNNGFMAALAAEVGDSQTASAMLAYADANWNPTWVNGGLHYPRNDTFLPAGASTAGAPQRFVSPRVNTLTGNALLGLTRVNVKDGLYEMYTRPWTPAQFRQPYLSDVRYPDIYVSRAVYDDHRKALVATLRPTVEAAAKPVSFSVGNLAPSASYRITINGRDAGRLAGGVATAAGGNLVSFDGGKLRVQAASAGPATIVVQEAS